MTNSPSETFQIGILVVPSYSQLTLAALVEPLRMANTVADRELYRWVICADKQTAVESSSGFKLAVDQDISEVQGLDAVFVLASYEVMNYASARLNRFLRKQVRNRVLVGGFDAAPFLLAEAGVLDGYRATTHWDDLENFRDAYPRVDVVPERYVTDRGRITTSGSLPSFDFALEFIRQQNGLMLAMNVSGNFLYDQARPGSESQYMIAASLTNARHPVISKSIRLMEHNLQSPLTIGAIAKAVGLTERSLQRRFQSVLNISPYQYYRMLRLDASRRLLDNTGLSITEVGVATGFESRNAFTRAFKNQFGMPPSKRRLNTE